MSGPDLNSPQGLRQRRYDLLEARRKQWTQEAQLNWVAGPGLPSPVRTATWPTPVFDLRPDLGDANDAAAGSVSISQAGPNVRQAPQPIWLTDLVSGRGGGNLFVQFLEDLANPHAVSEWGNTRVFAQEFAAPTSIVRMQSITPAYDITTPAFANGKQSAQLVFSPPGRLKGYVRYWKVVITFQRYEVGVQDPATTIYAGFY